MNDQATCPHPINRLRPSVTFPDKWITCLDCDKGFILHLILAHGKPGAGDRAAMMIPALAGSANSKTAALASILAESMTLDDLQPKPTTFEQEPSE